MHPLVDLVRRYVEDWLNTADPSVCQEILDPAYTLHIGGHDLVGRDDAYVPATMGQLEQFAGLAVTVHDLLVGHDRVAMRFSEHGTSSRHDGRPATWQGIVLFRWDGRRLTEAFVEEDYASRRAQLTGAPLRPVEDPMSAPWEAVPVDADADATDAVRRWLGSSDADGAVAYDDMPAGAAEPLLDIGDVRIHDLFSAGRRVAFSATQHGDVLGAADATTGSLHSAGIVDVLDGVVVSGRVVRDRLGFQRARATGSTGGHR